MAFLLPASGLQPAQFLMGPGDDAPVRALQQPVWGGHRGRGEAEGAVEKTAELQPLSQVRHRYMVPNIQVCDWCVPTVCVFYK